MASQDIAQSHISPDVLQIGPCWPSQSLFYGSTICVEWRGGGGEFSSNQNIMNIDDIDVALGQTQAETMAAIISSELFEANPSSSARHEVEESLAAFGLGVLNEIEQPDGAIALDQAVHRQTFMSAQGGSFSEYRPNDEDGVLDHVEIAAPNFYEPKDISLLLSNTHRSTRHSEDGIYDTDGILNCRISSSSYFITNLHSHLGQDFDGFIQQLCSSFNPNNRTIQPLIEHGGIPKEIRSLAEEIFRFSVAGIDSDAIDSSNPSLGVHYKLALQNFSSGEKFQQVPNEWGPSFFSALIKFLLRSPITVNTWSQAWVPMFLDYKFELYPVEISEWELGEVDFVLPESTRVALTGQIGNSSHVNVSDRAALFGKSGAVLSQQINRFIEELGDSTPSGMANLADEMGVLDIMTVVLQDQNSILHNMSESMLASGILDLVELEIIDAFGQTITLHRDGPEVLNPTVALSIETEDDGRYCLLKPRFSTPARLNLTLLDGSGNDSSRASNQISPVAAFLLPDHIDWSLEVFDADGFAAGQLRVGERDWSLGGYQSGRLMWDPTPGSETPLGSPAQIGNPHVDLMMEELIRISLDDEVALQEQIRDDDVNVQAPEGAFSALMRAIDTSLRAVDPLGKTAEDMPSLFAGRPIAVVRAELLLEFEDPTQISNPDEIFEVRLGAMERTTDGLLGYFINDDYTNFYAVLAEDSATNHESGNGISHNYLTFDPTIDVRVGQPVKLTLLMDPQSAIHATCGFLPQKEITLLREHKQAALSRLAPTYSFGPLLVEPSSVRMPSPDMMQPVNWSWISRPSTSEWAEEPIIQEDGKPHLAKGRATAWCGWLKMDPIEQTPFDESDYLSPDSNQSANHIPITKSYQTGGTPNKGYQQEKSQKGPPKDDDNTKTSEKSTKKSRWWKK